MPNSTKYPGKYQYYLIFGLGFPLAVHVSVTLCPFSAVTFFGGVTITGADHSGGVGVGGMTANTCGGAEINFGKS